jgi:hypothetical protein
MEVLFANRVRPKEDRLENGSQTTSTLAFP